MDLVKRLPPGDRAWRAAARRELTRARRYLQRLVGDLSEEEAETPSDDAALGCVKGHLVHLATRELEQLRRLVPGIAITEDGRPGAALGAVPDESTGELLDGLRAVRRLTLSLLDLSAPASDLAEPFLEIVNHELAHARLVRSLRRELGRGDVPEPSGRALRVDTDISHPPRYYLVSFDEDAGRASGRRGPAPVASLDEHRVRRARRELAVGHHLVASGDHRGALRAFERSHRLSPSADALTYQGWMHSLLGDDRRAEELCRDAIQIDPEFGNPYNDIGTYRLRRQDTEGAIAWFEKAKTAARYEPRHFPYVNLGRLYLSLGDPRRALSEFEGALLHDPGNPELRRAVQAIREQLTGD